jgi:hypothetical protein
MSTTTAPAWKALDAIARHKREAWLAAQQVRKDAQAAEKAAFRAWDTAQRDYLEALTGQRPPQEASV